MTRRSIVLALAASRNTQAIPDQFADLAAVWNPFAKSLNQGILDLKQWRKVVAAIDRLDGRKC